MSKGIQIFSDGSVNFHFNLFKEQKIKILKRDHKKKFLFKKMENFSNRRSDYSVKYKNQYLF